MKQLLIIAPDFVPSSLPPALRVRLLARHLPELGWRPTVISVDPRHYESPVDPENEALLPPDLEVVRAGALPAGVTRRFGVGDIGMRSLWQQWHAVARLCRTRPIDLILVPMPPYVPSLIARRARVRFGVPYVLDYIDPWVSDAWRAQPRHLRLPKRRLSDRLARQLEPRVVRSAAGLAAVSRAIADDVVARYPGLRSLPTAEIPYGGEPADFDYVRAHPRPNPFFSRDDGLLHLSYVGRGGWDLAPAARAVLEAFRAGLQRSPTAFGRLRFHFIGTSYDPRDGGRTPLVELAEELGVGSYVREEPRRVPYLTALQILLDSDALVAFGSVEPHYTASKIFPYVLATRPLLAVFHAASSVVAIVRETGAGEAVTFEGAGPNEAGAAAIGRWLEGVAHATQPLAPPATRWEAFASYTARAMAGRFAALFEAACADRRTEAGTR